LLPHRGDPVRGAGGRGPRRARRAEVPLVVPLPRQRDVRGDARAAVHHRRRDRGAPRRRGGGVVPGGGAGAGRGRAGGDGGHLRRGLPRLPRLRRVRLRGDAAADGAAPAAGRLGRGLPRLAPPHAPLDHDREARPPRHGRADGVRRGLPQPGRRPRGGLPRRRRPRRRRRAGGGPGVDRRRRHDPPRVPRRGRAAAPRRRRHAPGPPRPGDAAGAPRPRRGQAPARRRLRGPHAPRGGRPHDPRGRRPTRRGGPAGARARDRGADAERPAPGPPAAPGGRRPPRAEPPRRPPPPAGRAMITVPEADALLARHVRPAEPVTVPLAEATGRVLREDVPADRDYPPYDRVAMDGVAVSSEDVGRGATRFRVAWTQAAGEAPRPFPGPGQCIEIMTGAALPGGCDAVIRYEDLALADGWATLLDDVEV